MSFLTLRDVMCEWRESVLSGKGPELWNCGDGFGSFEIGPGLVTLIGAAPGAGKTALTMQMTVDALRLNPDLKALVCNVEMTPNVLLDRQLARLGGLQADWVRYRRLQGQAAQDRVQAGMLVLESIGDRLAFHTDRPTLADVARSADEFGAKLVVLDYIQRFTVGGDSAQDKRQELDSMMDFVRVFANEGCGVLAVSSVARRKEAGGSGYSGLNLASYSGSSGIEFGADSAWTLAPSGDDAPGGSNIAALCHKNRHGPRRILHLNFDKLRQSFKVVSDVPFEEPGTKPQAQPRRKPAGTIHAVEVPFEEIDDDTPF